MGKFIVVEGIDGSGKSLLTNRVYNRIRRANEGTEVIKTLEPGGTPTGSALRNLLLNSSLDMDPRTQMLLMTAARIEHVERLIKPALDDGAHVICDRYVDSTFAYQSAQGVSCDHIFDAHQIAGGLMPDLVLLLDVPIAVARQRGKKVGDRYESKPDSYFVKVRDMFMTLATGYSDTHHVIDATQDIQSVTDQACDAIRRIGVDVA